MIPKIIHYCWFGRNPLPDSAKYYIQTWRKYCPDYQIKEWNEDNFDLNTNQYVKEAYEAKKWAFITDYVRLYVLFNEGGVYMDTDVEVLKNLDAFLLEPGFSGFERDDAVPTGIMASEAGNPFIGELLSEYDEIHFLKPDGSMDLTTNVVRITNAAVRHGLKLDNSKQTVDDFTFYPKDYFCPKSSRTLELKLTPNSATIHHFDGSWDTDEKKKLRRWIKKHMPTGILKILVKVMDKTGVK